MAVRWLPMTSYDGQNPTLSAILTCNFQLPITPSVHACIPLLQFLQPFRDRLIGRTSAFGTKPSELLSLPKSVRACLIS
jgi:hypothetical protein